MRGRLIRPMLVDFEMVDQSATAPAQDDDFSSPRAERPFGAGGSRVTGVKYQAAVRLHAQVEVINFNAQRVAGGGNAPDYRTAFVVHFKELEDEGLVDAATGRSLLVAGTRVAGIYTIDGELERLLDDPPVIVVEPREIGFGLGGRRNLLMLVTNDRPQGLKETPA